MPSGREKKSILCTSYLQLHVENLEHPDKFYFIFFYSIHAYSALCKISPEWQHSRRIFRIDSTPPLSITVFSSHTIHTRDFFTALHWWKPKAAQLHLFGMCFSVKTMLAHAPRHHQQKKWGRKKDGKIWKTIMRTMCTYAEFATYLCINVMTINAASNCVSHNLLYFRERRKDTINWGRPLSLTKSCFCSILVVLMGNTMTAALSGSSCSTKREKSRSMGCPRPQLIFVISFPLLLAFLCRLNKHNAHTNWN